MNQSSHCHFFTDFVLIEAHLILEYANNTMPIKNKKQLLEEYDPCVNKRCMDWKIRTVIFDKLFVAFVGVEAANVILVLPESPKRKNLRQQFQENGLERKLKRGRMVTVFSLLYRRLQILSTQTTPWFSLQWTLIDSRKSNSKWRSITDIKYHPLFHSPKLYFTFGPHGLDNFAL